MKAKSILRYKDQRNMHIINPYKTSGNNPDAFVMEINTQGTTSFTLPLATGFTYNCTVNWGDNSSSDITVWNSALKTHIYSTPGIYTIQITGVCQTLRFGSATALIKSMLTKVIQWGNVGFTSLTSAFTACGNLTSFPAGVVTGIENCTSFYEMCYNCLLLRHTFSDRWLYEHSASIVSNGLYGMFHSCRNLVLNNNMFDVSKLTTYLDYRAIFYGTATVYSHTGTAQDLWSTAAVGASTTQCYRLQTGLSNYAIIPATWK